MSHVCPRTRVPATKDCPIVLHTPIAICVWFAAVIETRRGSSLGPYLDFANFGSFFSPPSHSLNIPDCQKRTLSHFAPCQDLLSRDKRQGFPPYTAEIFGKCRYSWDPIFPDFGRKWQKRPKKGQKTGFFGYFSTHRMFED